mgnify:CR=1 FL=1
MIYKNYIKPYCDRFFALLLLLLFSPIIVLCTILVRAQLGAPVFFTQERPGRNGKIFTIYKLRTMSNARDEKGELLPDSMRLCSIGSFMRKTSLDELPQLYNVLRGEMSFVGPRPLLPSYLPLYTRREQRRHDVLPGITGLAQVNGRNALNWEDKLHLDVEYVEHMSFGLDCEILLRTIAKVFLRQGITSEGEVSGAAFFGSKWRAALYGAGGHAKVVAEIAELCGYEICAVIDADTSKSLLGLQAISEEEFLAHPNNIHTILLGIGNNAARRDIFSRMQNHGLIFPALTHPSAVVSPSATIEDGAVIMAHAIIQPHAHIGTGAIINTASVIEHDNTIGAFAHVSPNATLAGAVCVGECTHIGAGSVAKEGITIGASAVVGAGAVCVHDVESNAVVVGNPAKPLSKKEIL